MFARARRGLALRYLVLFMAVLVVFSGIFLVVLAIVLQPAFDIAPEVANDSGGRAAYIQTLERSALALLLADLIVLGLVGVAGLYLADRTLRPIREAHDRQRRFVADASHEMRGPITAIRSTAEAALGRAGDVASTRQALAVIRDSAAQLGALTGDLLVLARSEHGVLARTTETIDVSVVVAEEVERFLTQNGRSVAIAISLTPGLVTRMDRMDLGRIIENLLDNAVRYGRPPIDVRTSASEGRVVVEVSDHGPGIALADAERIFEPFYRVHPDASAPAGSGLGLAIASELARRHAGRLSVDTRPGSGARFQLGLPRVRSSAEVDRFR